MLIRRAADIPSSEITDQQVYLRRREFLATWGLAAAGVATGGLALGAQTVKRPPQLQGVVKGPFGTTEALTPYESVTTYNNFYEFGTDKASPAQTAGSLRTRPWTVTVDGECNNPAVYDIDDLVKPHALEERVYRMRCVEGWSMVIPWVGIPLGDLIKRFDPTPRAKFVEFATLNDGRQMPGLRSRVLDWPYVEGLRLDEAMHPLTIIAVGLYGVGTPQPERRADAAGRAVEVRLQGHQVDRPHPVRRASADRVLAAAGRERVRVLLERQSAGRSPQVEPGHRAPPRRVLQAQHADVQRLRRPGGEPLRRDGPQEALLMADARAVRFVVKPAVFAAALVPLGLMAYGAATGSLGANPIEAITHGTGDWTLRFLLLTLALTPLRVLTGWNVFARFRRMLGLFAFFYGCLHLLTYVWLDKFFSWADIARDVGRRPFITAGVAAFLVLVPLAATSTAGMIRRLGGRAWKRLHRLVYLSAIAGVMHYWWLVKADVSRPRMYAIALGVLVALRLYVALGRSGRATAPPPRTSISASR